MYCWVFSRFGWALSARVYYKKGGFMKIEGSGKLLRIYIGSNDRYGNVPMYEALIQRAKEMGIAGCTIIRGIQGFGASHDISKARILRLSENLPLLIEIVDTEERVRQALNEFEKMIDKGGKGVLMTMETVEILRYKKGGAGA